MRKLRVSMLGAGGFAAFLAACFSDGEVLLGTNNGGIIAALLVAAVSFVAYILAGLIQNVLIVLPIAIVMMLAVLLVIRALQKK